MPGLFKKLGKVRRGLRYKLMLAFSIMSVIPILACIYLISIYIYPQLESIIDVSVVLTMAIVISLLGLGFARGIIDPVVELAVEARVIASGEYDRKISVASDDEIGALGESINTMTQRIKNNLDELKSYGQKTREINLDIHKKILGLSSLLQIGDIIALGSRELSTVLELAIQKVAMVVDTGYSVLYMPGPTDEGDLIAKASYNVEDEKLLGLVIREGSQNLLDKALLERTIAIVDESVKGSKVIDSFKESSGVKTIIAVPLYTGRKNIGILVVGNRLPGFQYKADDIDLIKVFAKQITIAIENDILAKKAEQLAMIDDLTGLFNKNYVISRLEEEIKRAIFYQRPCSFIVFNIDNFRAFRESKDELAAEEVLRKVAKLIRDNTSPMGKVGRVGGDEFAIVMPEKNKKEATGIAEEICKKIEQHNFARDGKLGFTVSAGVSENPIDGSTSDELYRNAVEALRRAKAAGKNRASG